MDLIIWSDGPHGHTSHPDQTLHWRCMVKIQFWLGTPSWNSVFWYRNNHLRYIFTTGNQFIKFSNPEIEIITSNPLTGLLTWGLWHCRVGSIHSPLPKINLVIQIHFRLVPRPYILPHIRDFGPPNSLKKLGKTDGRYNLVLLEPTDTREDNLYSN